MHTELVSFGATAPGAGGAAAAAVTGDSLIIKNTKGKAHIVAWWADQQLDGFQQVFFPSAHDTTRGYRAPVEVAEIAQLLPLGLQMEVQPQEQMSITIAGSVTAGDVEHGCMLVHYDDLPGVTQRCLTWDQLQSRTEKLTTVMATITAAGTGNAYSGEEAINAESDLLMANRDYAIIGARMTAQCASLNIRGPDTGNVRIGIPGDVLHPEITANWFGLLARGTGKPMIPIINTGNKASTLIDCLQDENNVAVPMALFLALLRRQFPVFPFPFELVNVYFASANAGASDVCFIIVIRSGGIIQRVISSALFPLGQPSTHVNFDQGAINANYAAGTCMRAALPQEVIIGESEIVTLGVSPADAGVDLVGIIVTVRFLPLPGRKPRAPRGDEEE